jgi:hypothetical protein
MDATKTAQHTLLTAYASASASLSARTAADFAAGNATGAATVAAARLARVHRIALGRFVLDGSDKHAAALARAKRGDMVALLAVNSMRAQYGISRLSVQHADTVTAPESPDDDWAGISPRG